MVLNVQIKQGVSFIAANKVYTSTNKTTVVWIYTNTNKTSRLNRDGTLFLPRGGCVSCLRACFGARLFLQTNLSEGADRVAGQLRRGKECPYSGVTKSGRVWMRMPESDARSVSAAMTPKSRDHVPTTSLWEVAAKWPTRAPKTKLILCPRDPQWYSRISLSLSGRILKEYRNIVSASKQTPCSIPWGLRNRTYWSARYTNGRDAAQQESQLVWIV